MFSPSYLRCRFCTPRPGPATLWGILESEPSPPRRTVVTGVDLLGRRVLTPNPAFELFGNGLRNLQMLPYSGGSLEAEFCRTATSHDLIRLNHDLFHDNSPHVRNITDPSVLLEQGVATVERRLFGTKLGVLVAFGVPILVHVEMLRPLPHLYWMFVDPRSGALYRVVHVTENAKEWKIVLLAVYGTDDFDLGDSNYSGPNFINAIRIAQEWAAVDFVRDTIVDYFKSYCTRLAITLRNAPVMTPGLYMATTPEFLLWEIELCYLRYLSVSGSYRTLPDGAFGSWALRAIRLPYLVNRLDDLNYGLRRDIMLALALRAHALALDYDQEDPIFLL
ncbi:hypothetical protein K445DRAFT_11548 [Daldinia sp. EC12]|nr:hypothetical protein K445DRAFT_11548 [Daldinia sp. EC12]